MSKLIWAALFSVLRRIFGAWGFLAIQIGLVEAAMMCILVVSGFKTYNGQTETLRILGRRMRN
ncbi:hypothetical protein HYPSUDRAFT_35014 [Hypholoma sublateritium FD-334 SS-4]|uniref:Uncharacterized protein n=1 Tax=Hypholoma sublateritium (strain FD-334 SS-4) TaxID=945553 RepID=A0A0D2PAC2_HYPSF|nr:hypothetical protein HYPSUDRAFT_35014 [Hypholoma sublateritium FD-334 SS-4]